MGLKINLNKYQLSTATQQTANQTTEKNNEGITVPKKNAGGSISFLPTIGRFTKVCYFYVGKKECSISVTNKHCVEVKKMLKTINGTITQ